MSSSPSRPFGHETVEIDAFLEPDSEDQQAPQQGLHPRRAFGWETAELDAVIVPEGQETNLPGYPFICLGDADFSPNADDSAEAGGGSRSSRIWPARGTGRIGPGSLARGQQQDTQGARPAAEGERAPPVPPAPDPVASIQQAELMANAVRRLKLRSGA